MNKQNLGPSNRPSTDLDALDSAFSGHSVARHLRAATPTGFAAASGFWKAALDCKRLGPRLRELVLLALHASATSLDSEAIRRHVHRALDSGASQQDVLDVLLSIVGVSNHALYSAVPLLMNELKSMGHDEPLPEPTPEAQAVKDDFISTRGFWNEQRDVLARCMPTYFVALSALSTEPWKNGSLTARERELIYIAIDSSVTHMYGPGLSLHIRRAIEAGASRDEILEVFQLVALIGMEGYILGADALYEPPAG